MSKNFTQFDCLHEIRAIAARMPHPQIFNLADEGMQMQGKSDRIVFLAKELIKVKGRHNTAIAFNNLKEEIEKED